MVRTRELVSSKVTKLCVISVIAFKSQNWQYKDVHSKRAQNQHHTSILYANYYLSVYDVYFKKKILIDLVLVWHAKVLKIFYHSQFHDTK